MSRTKNALRATTDRFIKHHFDRLFDALTLEVRTSAGNSEATTRAAAQEVRESLQQALDETRGAIQLSLQQVVDETRGTLQRDLDESRGAIQLTVQQAVDETRGAVLQLVDETRGTLQRDLDESRGAIQLTVQQAVHETRGTLQHDLDESRGAIQLTVQQVVDETRGTLQLELIGVRDEIQGEVGRFRIAFDDFRAKVEPRVVALEQRMDNLELRMLTLESEQKDYEDMRRRDMEQVREEAASLRDNLRGDIVELTRMLRMQGDAADQVAEALGRTIARLSAELEVLSAAMDGRPSSTGAPQPV